MKQFTSPFGHTNPKDDKRQMCPYCYNEDTQRITDSEDLKPYVLYHSGKHFRAYGAIAAWGMWHWSE